MSPKILAHKLLAWAKTVLNLNILELVVRWCVLTIQSITDCVWDGVLWMISPSDRGAVLVCGHPGNPCDVCLTVELPVDMLPRTCTYQ